MSLDLVGIDTDRARHAATNLSTGAATPEAHSTRLKLIGALGHFHDVAGGALAKIDETAEEMRLLADLFRTRADLAVRADFFPSIAAYQAYMQHALAAYRKAQGDLRTSLADDNAHEPGTYFATGTDLEDIFARVSAGNAAWVSASDLCASDAWLLGRGQIEGPDGMVYEIVVPEIRGFEEGTDDPVIWNMDWGTPEGGNINNLNGALAGFERKFVEVAIGHDGGQMSTHGSFALLVGGVAGAGYDDALAVRQQSGTPAPLSRYQDITFDPSLFPTLHGEGSRPSPATGTDLESLDDPYTNQSTDHLDGAPLPRTPGDATRVEGVNAAFGVIDLVHNATSQGPDAIDRIESEGNGMVVVEYLENPAGDRMARVIGYQIFENDQGEPLVTMNYAGVDDDGNFVADTPVRPRIQEGFDSSSYATTLLVDS